MVLKGQESVHAEIGYMRSEDSTEDYVLQGDLEDTPFTKAISNGQLKGSPASPKDQ